MLSLCIEPFLLPWRGNCHYRVTRSLTDYFKRELNLDLETSKLRSIMAKATANAAEKGIITEAERAASTRSTGHSEITRDRFYCPKDRYTSFLEGVQ